MKKNGFTMIELIISITLVGVILISMIGTLISIKESYNIINEDIEARTYSALVGKVINEHFMKNNGVKSVACTSDTSCNIILGNNKMMKLEILSMDKTYEYVYNRDGRRSAERTSQITTLRYSGSGYSYLKTINQVVTNYLNPTNQTPTGNQSTSGYKFVGLSNKFYRYESTEEGTEDLFTNITIEMSDPQYNINLYSTISVDPDSLATLYTITFDNNGGTGCTTQRVKDGYAIGDNLCQPTRTNWTFDGWYTNLYNGTKITSNTIIDSDLTVYAKWKPTNIKFTTARSLIATIGGKNYYKLNAGAAYVGYYYSEFETTGPILVGTSANSVAFYVDNISNTYTYETTINYNGTTYYISSSNGFVDGNLDNTSTSGIIKLIDQASAVDNARQLLYLANN